MTETTPDVVHYQRLLFALAYRLVGTVSDAEDLVQETFWRWQRVQTEGQTPLSSPKSWLTTTLTHLCIDHLRSARVQREEYLGPWLPEPVLTTGEDDPANHAVLADTLSLAFLTVLERLNPVERAIFLLHDLFGYTFAEIVPIVGKSEANCRQLGRRAREHVLAQRPRFAPDAAERERLTTQFLRTCQEGDLAGLITTLAEEITIWSDGGGQAPAARKPVRGAAKAAMFMLHLVELGASNAYRYEVAQINGQPGILVFAGEQLYSAVVLDIADGAIREIDIQINPMKLWALQRDLSQMR